MPKVSSVSIPGLVLCFYSNDHHPPHFHARRRGEWEIRVFFLSCTEEGGLQYEVKFQRNSIRSADMKALLRAVLEARDELYREWSEKVCSD